MANFARHVLVFVCLPVLIGYVAFASVVAFLATLMVFPAVIISHRFYWALPFCPLAIKSEFPRMHGVMKVVFETALSFNTIYRLLTAPLRPLPDFYIVGFPKCGTTTLSNYLKQHPAIGSVVGPPLNDTLTKESHFFSGVLGRYSTDKTLLYRTFFPTTLVSWWAEVVKGVEQVRDPVSAIFSAEIMMRNWGVDLPWSLMDEVTLDDERLKERPDETQLWRELQSLGPHDPLPEDMPKLMCTRLGMFVRFAKSGDRLVPFMNRFPRDNIMVIDFKDLVNNTESTLKQVFEFVGVDPDRYKHVDIPPGMKSDYKGRRVHPSMRTFLTDQFFKASNRRLQKLLDRKFDWIPDDA